MSERRKISDVIDSGGFMRARSVMLYLDISSTTFWRWVKEGKLPKGIRLSPRCTVWRKDDIDAAVEKMRAEGQGKEIAEGNPPFSALHVLQKRVHRRNRRNNEGVGGKEGMLPKGIRLSPRCMVWRKEDIDAVIGKIRMREKLTDD